MSQFDIHVNLNPSTKHAVAYLLDVQSDLLHALPTVMTIPLVAQSRYAVNPMRGLNPTFIVNDQPHVLVTQALAPIARRFVGGKVESLDWQQHEVISAVDCLFSGV